MQSALRTDFQVKPAIAIAVWCIQYEGLVGQTTSYFTPPTKGTGKLSVSYRPLKATPSMFTTIFRTELLPTHVRASNGVL